MGFGICVIGYIALVTDIIGGGVIAYPLLAYGLKKASVLNVNFFYAAVAALFCVPHSALVFFSFIGVIDENTVFYQASYCLFYAIYLLFHIFVFLGAAQVYRAGNAEKYASRAMSRLYMTAVCPHGQHQQYPDESMDDLRQTRAGTARQRCCRSRNGWSLQDRQRGHLRRAADLQIYRAVLQRALFLRLLCANHLA